MIYSKYLENILSHHSHTTNTADMTQKMQITNICMPFILRQKSTEHALIPLKKKKHTKGLDTEP